MRRWFARGSLLLLMLGLFLAMPGTASAQTITGSYDETQQANMPPDGGWHLILPSAPSLGLNVQSLRGTSVWPDWEPLKGGPVNNGITHMTALQVDSSGYPTLLFNIPNPFYAIINTLTNFFFTLTMLGARVTIDLMIFAFKLNIIGQTLGTLGLYVQSLSSTLIGSAALPVLTILVGMWALWRGIAQSQVNRMFRGIAGSVLILAFALGFELHMQRWVTLSNTWTTNVSGWVMDLFNAPAAKLAEQSYQPPHALNRASPLVVPSNFSANLTMMGNQIWNTEALIPWGYMEFGMNIKPSILDGTITNPPTMTGSEAEALNAKIQNQATGSGCESYPPQYPPTAASGPCALPSSALVGAGDSWVTFLTTFTPDSQWRVDGIKDALGVNVVTKHRLWWTYPGMTITHGNHPYAEILQSGNAATQQLMTAFLSTITMVVVLAVVVLIAVEMAIAQLLLLAVIIFGPIALFIGIIPEFGVGVVRKWLTMGAKALSTKIIGAALLGIMFAAIETVIETSTFHSLFKMQLVIILLALMMLFFKFYLRRTMNSHPFQSPYSPMATWGRGALVGAVGGYLAGRRGRGNGSGGDEEGDDDAPPGSPGEGLYDAPSADRQAYANAEGDADDVALSRETAANDSGSGRGTPLEDYELQRDQRRLRLEERMEGQPDPRDARARREWAHARARRLSPLSRKTALSRVARAMEKRARQHTGTATGKLYTVGSLLVDGMDMAAKGVIRAEEAITTPMFDHLLGTQAGARHPGEYQGYAALETAQTDAPADAGPDAAAAGGEGDWVSPPPIPDLDTPNDSPAIDAIPGVSPDMLNAGPDALRDGVLDPIVEGPNPPLDAAPPVSEPVGAVASGLPPEREAFGAIHEGWRSMADAPVVVQTRSVPIETDGNTQYRDAVAIRPTTPMPQDPEATKWVWTLSEQNTLVAYRADDPTVHRVKSADGTTKMVGNSVKAAQDMPPTVTPPPIESQPDLKAWSQKSQALWTQDRQGRWMGWDTATHDTPVRGEAAAAPSEPSDQTTTTEPSAQPSASPAQSPAASAKPPANTSEPSAWDPAPTTKSPAPTAEPSVWDPVPPAKSPENGPTPSAEPPHDGEDSPLPDVT